MARIPTVGTKELHTAQLSPRERRILHRRARKANQREYAPVIAADKQAFGIANRAYGREASSVQGAASMTEDMLAQALRGLKASGLSGSYLRQAVNELSSRQGDAASAIPFLLSDAREQRSTAMTEAQQQLAQDRGEMKKGVAEDFDQLLKEGRTAASGYLKEQQAKREAEAEEHGDGQFDPTSIENAKLALKDALAAWAKNPMVEGSEGEEIPLRQLNPLRTKEQWLSFAAGLEKQYDGFGLAEINHVIQQLLSDRKRKEHEGRLPQPGVPGPGRG